MLSVHYSTMLLIVDRWTCNEFVHLVYFLTSAAGAAYFCRFLNRCYDKDVKRLHPELSYLDPSWRLEANWTHPNVRQRKLIGKYYAYKLGQMLVWGLGLLSLSLASEFAGLLC